MSKLSIVRFLAVVIAVLCIGARVSADVELKGPDAKKIVFDKDTFEYKMDYTKTYAYYNITNKQQYYTLDIGGCKLEFRSDWCFYAQVNHRDQNVKKEGADGSKDDDWRAHHDDHANGTVKASSIRFRARDFLEEEDIDYNYPCDVQFDSDSVPGKYVIDVSLSGTGVAPDLVVNFVGAELFDTSMIPTTTTKTSTTTTTQASTSTTPPVTTPPVTTPAPTSDPCDEVLSEPRYFCNDDGYVEE